MLKHNLRLLASAGTTNVQETTPARALGSGWLQVSGVTATGVGLGRRAAVMLVS